MGGSQQYEWTLLDDSFYEGITAGVFQEGLLEYDTLKIKAHVFVRTGTLQFQVMYDDGVWASANYKVQLIQLAGTNVSAASATNGSSAFLTNLSYNPPLIADFEVDNEASPNLYNLVRSWAGTYQGMGASSMLFTLSQSVLPEQRKIIAYNLRMSGSTTTLPYNLQHRCYGGKRVS